MNVRFRFSSLAGLAPLALAFTLLTLPGCGADKPANKGQRAAKAKRGEPVRILIQDQENRPLATFIRRPNLVRVEYTEEGNPRMLEARLGGTVHRYWDGKVTMGEAARTGEQIRLRSEAGELLWTIILRGERVRINPPPEGAESFWLSRADDTRLRVSRGEATLGRVTLDAAKKRVKIRNSVGDPLWDAPASKVEPWLGVLTLPDLPTVERYLLMMELWVVEGAKG